MIPTHLQRALAFAVALGIAAAAQPARADDAFEFVALGDMPYKLHDDYKRFETLIAAINKVKPAFSIHVGDIKSGSTPCSDELIEKVHGYFKTFEQPLIYTPGDNEWTDCHREKAGKFDPLERLAHVRTLFFSDDKSQGATPITVTRQADVSDFKDMVENARWTHGGVVFATIDAVGSNNNLDRNAESADEFYKRNAANVAWIADAFATAKKDGAKGVVIAMQANLHLDVDPETNAGFRDTINALTKGALDFGKPLLVIQGDEHVFIVDQPFKDKDENPIETAFRLQVMGEQRVGAVRVRVDPADATLFSFRPLVPAENLKQPAM
jgi:hypothetical protein